MCDPSENKDIKIEAVTVVVGEMVGSREVPMPEPDPKPDSDFKTISLVLGVTIIALALTSTIILASSKGGNEETPVPMMDMRDSFEASEEVSFLVKKEMSSFSVEEDNICTGAKLAFENKLCADIHAPQAGGNVTKGYVGGLDVGDIEPVTVPFFQNSMCPTNVHWHLGTEHYSVGQYDENGSSPNGNQPRPEWADEDHGHRHLADDHHKVRDGFRCHHYDETDPKFTTPYEWKHCVDMEIGETYEVHWPHSAAGACGTPDQYQTPFYDGVFCHLDMDTFITVAQDPQNIANAVGVHGQVFTIVNDEEYFYPNLIRGMVVDEKKEMGTDLHYYTGSTTGTTRDNEICSQYAPITWQVDRKCHMISASSFEKMCYEMKLQRDNMSDDLHAHGSRELVKHDLVANNQFYPDADGSN